MTTRWPDSRTALRKPGLKNGVCRRGLYEDRSARISILAERKPPKPDTLKQTDQPPISANPIADGAGHTLRRQLIHGARAALPYVAEKDTPLGRWAKALMTRAHRNVAVVAFANKLARIAWAVLRRGQRFAAGRPMTG